MEPADGTINYPLKLGSVEEEPGLKLQSSYVFKSCGELLWALVHVKTESSFYKDVSKGHFGYLDGLATAWSVSVYVFEDSGGVNRWLKRDRKSFADRILFLGRPNSFAVNAARQGMSGGYSFLDEISELVETLPAQWTSEDCMWITPQPVISTNEEIREKIACVRIYVGNLPRKVDSDRLRQFFSRHGKVKDSRVMRHRKTRTSRGFGFVTMATKLDVEPASVVAKLHGLFLDGHPLQVKLADEE
ncbi:hypothetical protein PR202_ga24609 [Eleusine coracana subsp. coracana]|uniref:RRM domain-containing protein n=1 Tax=Eleusine coracana subsp. coracana TaxID=191504 RepID=A0AAV5D9D7_ELECO|nr:hypothetical protein PR202_ga24609 [Eleusine coracana subsp. coracana]